MTDRRLTPFSGRVALSSLRGQIDAERFSDGEGACLSVPIADLLSAPGGARDRQLVFGDVVRVIDRAGDHSFVRAEKDGYCGWVPTAALGPERVATHWVAAPATHVYAAPDIKSPDRMGLTLGSAVAVTATTDRFAALAGGGHVPLVHLRAVTDRPDDPAAIAESLAGTPYLWGGNSHAGIDCSGLVQAALLACGIPCPGDSDLQEQALGRALRPGDSVVRNDLLFWKGHVAIAQDETRLIHANAHHMSVRSEPMADAIARIAAAGGGEPRVRRLSL